MAVITGGFDVIGDVHGQASKLTALLQRLGYSETGGVWRHPERQVIFVGDLIDRGPENVAVVETVRPMVEAGSALIVAGNHEFNAVAWFQGDRDHNEKNRGQHAQFLDEVKDDPQKHAEIIDWFTTFPLWLEVDGIRVVHASWDPGAIRVLSERYGPDCRLTPALVAAASVPESSEYHAIEILLKGPEVELAPHPSYLDGGGNPRTHARWTWWNPNADNLRDGVRMPGGTTTVDHAPYPELPTEPLANLPVPPYTDRVPLFFGHYWMTGTPTLTSDYTACVDFSAAKEGPLVAYRWSGETMLDSGNFVASE